MGLETPPQTPPFENRGRSAGATSKCSAGQVRFLGCRPTATGYWLFPCHPFLGPRPLQPQLTTYPFICDKSLYCVRRVL